MKYIKTRDVKSPNRGTALSSGIDFYIPEGMNYIIEPNTNVLIPLGIKIILEDGYDLTFFNKSGIASKKNLIIGACVIDNDYRGELILDLKNVGNETHIVHGGDKIIQGVIRKVELFEPQEISEKDFNIDTERSEGGFGSTGNL